MSISQVLKQRRKQLGYTLLDIAKMMNVSEATVQRWESGNIKSLRYERIGKLAQTLQVSPAVLMGWEEQQKEPPIPDGKSELIDTIIRELAALPEEKQREVLRYIQFVKNG